MKKTYSMASKLVAAVTAAGLVGLGCTASEDPELGGDPGQREVTLDVWSNLEDDTGAKELSKVGTTTATLDQLLSGERELIVDGVATHDRDSLRSGSEIVVPLNTGDTATLVRDGDVIVLASFTGEDDGTSEMPRGAVRAVRLLSDGIEIYLSGSEGPAPDSVLRLAGVEDLDAERSALVNSLALDALLVSLEDGEQIAPSVAIAIIAAIVAAIWLATCGNLAWHCAYQCEGSNGFEVQCAFTTVSVNPTFVRWGGGLGCRCN